MKLVQGLLCMLPGWKGLVLVHWWVKLDFVPLMGNAVTRGVSIGIICLNNTFDNLSAGG